MGKQPREGNHFVSVDRERPPIRRRRTPPHARDRPGAGTRSGRRCPITFTPHLLPIDQGELLSCYVTPTRGVDQAELGELYRQRYGNEPFIDLLAGVPGVRDVRETQRLRDPRTRR